MKVTLFLVLSIVTRLTLQAQQGFFYMNFPENNYYVPKTHKAEMTGSSGIFDQARQGFLVLTNGDTLGDLAVQYDCNYEIIYLRKNQVNSKESNTDLSVYGVKYVHAAPSVLFNPHNIGFLARNKQDKITGLAELNYYSKEADFILGRYYIAKVERADYNPVFDSGSKDDQVIIKSKRYIFYEGEYFLLPNQKNKLIETLKNEFDITADKKLKLKSDDVLIKLLNDNLKKD